ncbi:Arylsulfatase [Sphingobacterium daejeonense]|nr:Arylsulfatase [Sphingobacterium daejeonense]
MLLLNFDWALGKHYIYCIDHPLPKPVSMKTIFKYLYSFCLFMVISSTSFTQAKMNKGSNNPRPNIILIVGESHRAEALGVSGNPFIKTPNLDWLAKNGLNFSNSHVTTAICSVSRASILSGQHQSRHGIDDFSKGFNAETFAETLPLQLKKHGYKLAWVGPYGVSKPPSTDAFDYWDPSFPWMENGIHHTDNVALKTNNWLENYRSEDPFFIQINFNAAHEIDPKGDVPAHYLLQDKVKGMYDDVNITPPPSAAPEVWNSFPDFFKTDENIGRKRWQGFFSDNELLVKNTRDYYASVSGVDEAIGNIMAKLKDLGISDNTIIVFISDHGFSLGEHGVMGKWFPFKESTHVPLIIYNPLNKEIQGKKDKKSFALNIDIAPTILGMLNFEAPSGMQGVDLVDMYEGKIKKRNQFFYEHTFIGSPGLPKTQALVSKDYKYINFIEHGYEMLYDLKKDPNEMVNVASDPKYKDILDRLRLVYQEEKEKSK